MANIKNDELDEWLDRVVRESVTGARGVEKIRRERFPHIGSYDCERVTVELRGGEEIALFLKDFGTTQQSKDQPQLRRLRELRVYEQLLDETALGTPKLFGAMFDERREKCWMLLELVEGEVVDAIDLRGGVPAVEWLARLQRQFSERRTELARCDFLLRHDAEYYEGKRAAARRDVLQIGPEHTARIDDILACYRNCIALFLAQPVSLVHGGYIPWHIFVDRATKPMRVCVVDWELAAHGATLYDLAIFVDDAAPELRQKLCEAYRDAAQRNGLPVPSSSETAAVVDGFRLHRVIDWLSRSVEKAYAPEKMNWLIERAETLTAEVARREGSRIDAAQRSLNRPR